MKKTILEKIKFHCDNKKFTRITRQTSEDTTEISRGYIVDYSENFIVLQLTDDFEINDGFIVIPVSLIKDLRFNSHDKYYDKIMFWEKEIEKVAITYKTNLTDWESVFRSIKKTGLNVIIECENPSIDTFTIGPIVKITKSKVSILYFDPSGFSDEEPTFILYKNITQVTFNSRYTNVFSKYIRRKKTK